ncbi:carbonic anhydrase [Micrococcales bacterium 31B]|nr:carbonic anhydrase [Micrococcales bacterium 31B]
MTPAEAWTALKEGNARFVSGESLYFGAGLPGHSRHNVAQRPSVVLFGCADSRVAAEIIFDQGLGDMFVIRTAGHVVDSSVLGSLEFAAAVLEVPLVVILGHDGCGAVRATIDALDNGEIPHGFIRDLVERVAPSILEARQQGHTDADDLGAQHVHLTGRLILERSRIIADRLASGKLAIAGVTYQLAEGKIKLRGSLGQIGEEA